MKSMPWRSIRRGGFCTLLVVINCLVGAFALGVSPAHAGKMYFGTQDTIKRIQDVAIKGKNGEELYLGHKYSTHSFVAPYSLSDDGYVLGVKGRESYYSLTQQDIEKFQASGLLPSPLPAYEISTIDYLFGHLLWIVLIVIALFIVGGSIKQKRKMRIRAPALPFFKSALEQHSSGNLNGAVADYTKAIEIDPTYAEPLLNRGIIHMNRGNHEEAIADLTKAINCREPNVTLLAHLQRSKAYEKIGYEDKVIADLTTVINAAKKAKDANVAGVYFSRGNAYVRKQDYKKAIADFTQVIKLEPHAKVAYRARAEAYQQRGKSDLAQADYSAAVNIAGQRGAATS